MIEGKWRGLRIFLAAMATVIAFIGVSFSVYIMLSPRGPFPGLATALVLITLMLTNALSLVFTLAYWLVSGRPARSGTVVLLQFVVMAVAVLWYLTL